MSIRYIETIGCVKIAVHYTAHIERKDPASVHQFCAIKLVLGNQTRGL